MNDALIDNYIETQYITFESRLNTERLALYSEIKNEKLRLIFATLHKDFETLFKKMNSRLPTKDNTAYYWADNSRNLKSAIEITFELQEKLKGTENAFEIDRYYYDLLGKCEGFIFNGGSTIPPNTPKVTIYITVPIFIPAHTQFIERSNQSFQASMSLIGEGSFAKVFKCRDDFFDKGFAIKRALDNLNSKEMVRFRQEFDEMKKLSSLYVLEVYRYDSDKNQYYMELMDSTLDRYISTNNGNLSITRRVSLARQALRGFGYLHSKGLLHRDISPKNILLKQYEDVTVVKIADFGLVKTPASNLTSVNTELKGYFNDPALRIDGWNSYEMAHEMYALTMLLYFIMTGKTNVSKVPASPLKEFVLRGLNPEKNKRFKDIKEISDAFDSSIN